MISLPLRRTPVRSVILLCNFWGTFPLLCFLLARNLQKEICNEKSLICILFISSVISCNNKAKQQATKKQEPRDISLGHRIPGSIFLSHFGILDSASKPSTNDTIYCCSPTVEFMELQTGISSSTDRDYAGPLGFLKEDLRKWHEWYDKEYRQKNK